MKLQAFGPSKPESLQSQTPSRPENRLLISRLDGSSRTTDYCASEDARQIYELIGHLPEAVGRTLRDLGYEKAHELIERNREKVAAVAEALAQRLELSEAEIAALLT